MDLICSCGQSFAPRSSHQRFCSERCQDRELKKHRIKAFDRPFVAFDGEGEDGKYTLLADSTGRTLRRRSGLSTTECLDFLLASEKGVNNVWFGQGYDVNMILADLPLFGWQGSLWRLYHTHETRFADYYIRYIPRKQLTISHGKRGRPDYASFNSYDTFGFFQTDFIKSLIDWHIPIDPLILEGKASREDFSSWPMDRIVAYNAAECTALTMLMDALRTALREADLQVSRWDGAGAIAASWLARHEVTRYYNAWPEAMDRAVASAFFGGNINIAGIGHAECGEWDLHSAYPAGVANCPDLTRLEWHYEQGRQLPARGFDLVHLRWDLPQSVRWPPLPYRTSGGTILYPHAGAGWYYACEAAQALERFGARRIIIDATWISRGDQRCPLGPAIERDYQSRLVFKSKGRAAEKGLKLGLNAVYGKAAQRAGYGDRIPKYRNMLWAGYVTAQTRAKVQRLIDDIGEQRMIAVATDGVLCTQAPPVTHETQLGSWGANDVQATDVLGSGIYQTYTASGDVAKHKQRGFSAEPIDYQRTLARWLSGLADEEEITLRRFVGMGLALASEKYRPDLRRFIDVTKNLQNPILVGTTKRLPADWSKHSSFVELPARPCKDPSKESAVYKPALHGLESVNECVE